MEEFHTPDTAPQIPSEWAVDLTREEYVDYYLLFSKLSGPFRLRHIQLIASAVMFVALTALTVYEWTLYQTVDWLTMALGSVLLLFSLGLWWFVPVHLRRTARRVYDETLDGGYSYYGTLRVSEGAVEKENAQGVNRIRLDGGTLFVENAQMMVFITVGRRAIVLPARCMSAEAAAAVRRAADKLPYRNRRFIARIQPRGEAPIPVAVEQPTVVWEKEVRYEPQELAELMRHTATQNYLKQLPTYSLLSMVCAVTIGWDGESLTSCIGAFLLFLGLMTVFNLVSPRRRARVAAENASIGARTVNIRLTERGVWMTDHNSGFTVLPWSAVQHVINRDDFVEITRGRQTMRIPKRYIDDIDAFDTLISTYWKNKK